MNAANARQGQMPGRSPAPRWRHPLAALFCLGLALTAAPQTGQSEEMSGKLGVELNKLEPATGGGCQAYFLFRNETGKSFEAFEMSLAVLDAKGVIDRLLTVDAAPLPVQRTTLKLFAIPELACDNISEILLHDMAACRPQNEGETDCFPFLALDSKASAALVR
ncbi:hypothetical protein [Phaeovulum sp. W22_SRMD_FR3]|uniref:hypothetical protein n=1 Tax=Phaeovulum sp. W22_SRMD_FR3 TaxID=3240274 RepID=UPI003F973F17